MRTRTRRPMVATARVTMSLDGGLQVRALCDLFTTVALVMSRLGPTQRSAMLALRNWTTFLVDVLQCPVWKKFRVSKTVTKSRVPSCAITAFCCSYSHQQQIGEDAQVLLTSMIAIADTMTSHARFTSVLFAVYYHLGLIVPPSSQAKIVTSQV